MGCCLLSGTSVVELNIVELELSNNYLEYKQNKFSLEFLSCLKSPNLHHIRSADINQKSAYLLWCKFGDFNQDKNSRLFFWYSTILSEFIK
jgi:hypothetical protein